MRILALSLLVATLAHAQVTPTRPPDLQALEFRQASLQLTHDYRAIHDVPSRAADWESGLRAIEVDSQSARIDTRSGRWATLLPTQPLIPGKGVGNSLTWPSDMELSPENIGNHAWDRFMEYLQVNEPILGVSIAELAQPGRVTVHKNGDLIQIYAQRMIDGIAVHDAYLTAVLNHGNLVLFNTSNWSDMDARLDPGTRLTATDAALMTQDYASRDIESYWRDPFLRIIPTAIATYDVGQGYHYRLAYVTSPNLDGNEDGHWECLVDAYTGQVLAFQDTYNYFGEKEIKGGVFPVTNNGVASQGGVQVPGYPMPYADVVHTSGTFFTDTGGNLAMDLVGMITTNLQGPFLQMTDDCGPGPMSESTMADLLDLGVSGTDCDTPPGAASASNTSATRSGFYEIGKIQEMARSHLPLNTWLQNPLPSQMNINDTCNATGGASQLRFYRSGGGCANTGELAGVFDHEWGHGMDASDANPGISVPGEGIADIYASLRLNSSCIGRNFQLGTNCGGYGDPCLDCDGVRDIDFANRTSGMPHDIAWVDANCPGGFFSFGPCGESVHCGGAVYAEAVWDLWNRDLTGAPYNMSVEQAREIAAHLTFIGAGLVGDWFTCDTGGEGGCNGDGGYLNYLAADDDNGNLMDGTPHMGAIYAAFNRHGAACSTLTVQDSGCAGTPTTAPVASGSSVNQGAMVSWSAVAGATSYRLFRTEGEFGCDFGKVLLTETISLAFADAGLQNGREYYYQVAAMGPTASCIGPLSSCVTVTPGESLNCASLLNTDWPTVNILFFVDCLNMAPKTKTVATMGPDLTGARP